MLRVIRGALALLAPTAWGALRWESTTVERRARLGDEFVEAAFRFNNSGDASVAITRVETSCTCTAAEPAKKTYAPGETGVLLVRFTVGDRKGLQEKTLTVATAEAPDSPTTLTLRVQIPELIELERHLVVWRRGDPPAAREVAVGAGDSIDIKVLGAVSNHPDFSAEVLTDEPGRRYRVRIVPAVTAVAARATIVVKFEATLGRIEERRIVLVVE
ncbi:MAG: hypothetical protein RLZZ15_2284 [Verrucomicrobiota bacterium]